MHRNELPVYMVGYLAVFLLTISLTHGVYALVVERRSPDALYALWCFYRVNFSKISMGCILYLVWVGLERGFGDVTASSASTDQDPTDQEDQGRGDLEAKRLRLLLAKNSRVLLVKKTRVLRTTSRKIKIVPIMHIRVLPNKLKA
ncbi:MAG: hypothetical protein Q9219_006935 [cf. Caloplaca sp. 3 TL-2023]